MRNVKVFTLRSFEHDGPVPRHTTMLFPERVAQQLAQKGLVEIVRNADDEKKKEHSSVSPVAPALQEPTVKPLNNGGKAKKKANRGA